MFSGFVVVVVVVFCSRPFLFSVGFFFFFFWSVCLVLFVNCFV